MKFIADLHVHSKYSRATAKNLDLENLYIAAQLKGVSVVGTGDFTHPEWFAEIKEKLEQDGSGLFRLKKSLEHSCDEKVPKECRSTVRFMLQAEISNIYKKNGLTRKNHNLVYLPDLKTADRFNEKLDKIGNITSDGRPILGLDARNLLELVLEVTDEGFFIPAHIWTPWFSLLGSKSGFDSVEECFEDLTPHIFAVETGLSSDPAMNWRVSHLDGLTLVSNSDAHSPMKLGREANIFQTELSFPHIRSALDSGDPGQFLGTVEFFPQEGKYHLDGHRKCGVRLEPEKTRRHGDLCPVCEKALTLGVLYRVEALADRAVGESPERTHPFHSLISLVDILSEIHGVGPASKKINQLYLKLLDTLGPELKILKDLPLETIETASMPLLTEAVRRMRAGSVDISAGFDGQYGRISLFRSGEKETLMGQAALFNMPAPPKTTPEKRIIPPPEAQDSPKRPKKRKSPVIFTDAAAAKLNDAQQSAVMHGKGPLLIVAGPGTGKTLTLTRRISHLIKSGACAPDQALAVTFTHKAAREMRQRLTAILGPGHPLPLVATFHALCHRLLAEMFPRDPYILIDEVHRRLVLRDAILWVSAQKAVVSEKIKELDRRIMLAKQQMMGPEEFAPASPEDQNGVFQQVYAAYQHLLSIQKLMDFDDLIFKVVQRVESDPSTYRGYRERYTHLFVDEYQDVNRCQYHLVRSLAPP